MLLFGSGSVCVGGGCRPLSVLPRSILGFVLCCIVFELSGVRKENGGRYTFTRLGGAGVRRSSSSSSSGNNHERVKGPFQRLRKGWNTNVEQDSDERSDAVDPSATPDNGGVVIEDALNLANAVGLQTLSSLVSGGQGPATEPRSAADDPPPKVVWIMSFGGSGTSYTITNLEQLTGYTTGTNYAADIRPNVPILSSFPDGPFLHMPAGTVPSHVMSKTHCGAYCMDCGPENYHSMTFEAFEKACRTCSVSVAVDADATAREAMLSSSTMPAYTTYDTPIEKAIHLIRSPFDNLVGRMHLASRHRIKRGETGFDDTPAGYAEWCQYLDAKYGAAEAELADLDDDLPCRAEWYRYVQWHNRAWEVTSRTFDSSSSNVHYLHYENYSTQYDATVRSLLEFVGLEPAPTRAPLPFLSNKTYVEYFSPHDRERAKQYVRTHAHPQVWDLLAGYF